MQLSAFLSRLGKVTALGFAAIMALGLAVATVGGTGKALYRASMGEPLPIKPKAVRR